MRRRADEGGEGALHPLAFNGADPDERVGHRRSPCVESVGWGGDGGVVVDLETLVETATEGARMVRRGTHTGAAVTTGRRDRLLHHLMVNGEMTAGGGCGESDGWGHRRRSNEVDPRRRG